MFTCSRCDELFFSRSSDPNNEKHFYVFQTEKRVEKSSHIITGSSGGGNGNNGGEICLSIYLFMYAFHPFATSLRRLLDS
jgi:hypothetical protein